MEELEVEHTELMTSSGSSGDLSNLSSSTTLAVSQHASPAGNDEIQVWISYESKDSEDETTQTTILRMMPNVSEKHNLRTKPDVLTSPLSPPFSFFFGGSSLRKRLRTLSFVFKRGKAGSRRSRSSPSGTWSWRTRRQSSSWLGRRESTTVAAVLRRATTCTSVCTCLIF